MDITTVRRKALRGLFAFSPHLIQNLSKRVRRDTLVLVTLATALLTSGTVTAQIVNGGFEDPDIATGTFDLFTTIPGWIAGVGLIEIQDSVAGSPFEGSQFVELDSNFPSSMSQTVTGLTVGQDYELSFAFSARTATSIPLDNILQVTWDGAEVFNQQADTINPVWTVYTVVVTASAASQVVTFTDVSPDSQISFGVYVDDVQLNPVSAVSDDFAIVIIPDTQTYSEDHPEIFEAQMDWIVANRDIENIVYVAHLGDLKNDSLCDNRIVANGTGDDRTEWDIVDQAFDRLEAAVPPIPYGVVPGNHDFNPRGGQCPNWDTQRPLDLYNDPRYFHPSRFAGRPWYGDPGVRPGNFRTDDPNTPDDDESSNEDNFTLFDGTCGIQFIAINLAYKQGANPTGPNLSTGEIEWADELLKAYPNRLGILTSHHFLQEQGRNNTFNDFNGNYGRQVYDGVTMAPNADPAIGPNPNLLMMLSAHKRGEAWRIGKDRREEYGLQPLHAILQDYQSVDYPSPLYTINEDTQACQDVVDLDGPGSGDFYLDAACNNAVDFSRLDGEARFGNGGFIRIMRFDTSEQMVNVETFAPVVDFTGLDYPGYPAAVNPTRPPRSAPPNRPFVLKSDYRPQDLPAYQPPNEDNAGLGMGKRTASNFSFSFAGYVAAPNCN